MDADQAVGSPPDARCLIASPVGDGWQFVDDGTFAAGLGAMWQRIEGGEAQCELQTGNEHANRSGLVHGGVLATLLDRTMSLVAIQHLGAGVPTANLTINFLKPGVLGSRLTASAKPQRCGRNTAVIEGGIVDANGLLATATGIWIRRSG